MGLPSVARPPHPLSIEAFRTTPRHDLPPCRRRSGRRRARSDQDVVAAKCRCLEAVVAATFRLDRAELRAPSRREAPTAFARQVAMYVAHVWFALSLTEVGRRFDRDRTTVAHACRVVEDRRDDPAVDRVVSAIESAADLWARLPETGRWRDLDGVVREGRA